jgi:hypothetical protein
LIKNLLQTYLVILLAYAGAAESRQLAVPGEFARIQLAIEQAENGDSVIVAPGNYPEAVDFIGRSILLLGNPDDPATTVITGSNEQRCVNFSRGESGDAILDGFALVSGVAEYGSGILVTNNSNPTIRNCFIRLNRAAYGAGICVMENSRPDISYCLINNNISTLAGGGIGAINSQGISITNCTISRNRAEIGGGINVSNSQLILENDILWDNDPEEIRSPNQEIVILFSDIKNGLDGIDGLVDWGDGNIDGNPSFINPDEGDFSLNWNSPCINTGNPGYPEDPDGTQSDMGAIPVSLEPNSAISLSANNFDFDVVQVGDSNTYTLWITNIGVEALEIIDMFIEGDYFTADLGQIDALQSRQTEQIEISFTPEEIGIFDGRLFINSNDPENDVINVWLTGEGMIPPSIYIEPLTIGVEIDSGEVEEYAINITNEGGSDLIWRIYTEYIEPDFANSPSDPVGPRRDDAGDLIVSYQLPYTTSYGMAWDGEHMWGVATNNNRLIEFDPESEEVISDFEIHIGPRALTFDGDFFWTSSYNPSNNIYLYNTEGELVDRFELPIRNISGLAFDNNSRVYINSWNEQRIYVVDIDSREVIANFEMLLDFRRANYKISRLEWVPGHFDGHLWSIVGNNEIDVGFAVRVDVNDDWQARERQRFQFQHVGHTSIAHDGANLWHAGEHENLLWHVYEDGIRDMKWLGIDPPHGLLQSEEDADVILVLNSNGLDDGVYASRVQIVSNDLASPEVEISVTLFVGNWSGINDETGSNYPLDFSLDQNYPNPFNAETRIQYTIHEPELVSISVYDVNGNEIIILNEGFMPSGSHQMTWNADKYPAGVYFAKLSTSKESATIKMLLVK